MKNAKAITTNLAAGARWKETEVSVHVSEDCMHVINIYPEIQKQTIRGFGGAFTEASTYNYSLLGKENQKKIMDAYFAQDGLRYNLGRTHIHSCDFALGNYTYVEEGDMDLSTFSIEHDKKNMIPMIKEALEKSPKMALLASPWSPPAYMKTNNDMNHGGKLKPECRKLWAEYVAKYIKAYRGEGLPIEYLTVQNEPMAVQTWDSCIYTAEEERDFVKEYLGPTLQEEGLADVKLFIWDHNKEELYSRAKTIYEDEEAAKYVTGAAVHWYTGDHFEGIEITKECYPDKEVFFTEGCVEFSRFADTKEIWKAEMYAHDMIGNLKSGVSAFFDWNLLLDEKGGPNHVGNFCAAPIMCCPSKDTVDIQPSYYYIGQLSRYIARGAKQIGTTRYTDAIETAAFLNPDGQRTVVLLNRTDCPIQVEIRENGMGIMRVIEAHSIETIIYND